MATTISYLSYGDRNPQQSSVEMQSRRNRSSSRRNQPRGSSVNSSSGSNRSGSSSRSGRRSRRNDASPSRRRSRDPESGELPSTVSFSEDEAEVYTYEKEQEEKKKPNYALFGAICCAVLLLVVGIILIVVFCCGSKVEDAPRPANTWTRNPEGFWATYRKAGMAVDGRHNDPNEPLTLNADMLDWSYKMQIQWHTNFTKFVDPALRQHYPEGMKFVSQHYNANDTDFAALPNVATDSLYAKVLLTWDEPDNCLGDIGTKCFKGRTVNPADATEVISRWMAMVRAARAKGFTEFVSPTLQNGVPSRFTTPDGQRTIQLHSVGDRDASTWLPNFLFYCYQHDVANNSRECRSSINYLGTHMFGSGCRSAHWGSVVPLLDQRIGGLTTLKEWYNYHYGFQIEGIFVTEMAGDDSGACQAMSSQQHWMEQIVPALMNDDDVIAFAWFSYGPPVYGAAANLWDYNTHAVTALGSKYAELTAGPITPSA